MTFTKAPSPFRTELFHRSFWALSEERATDQLLVVTVRLSIGLHTPGATRALESNLIWHLSRYITETTHCYEGWVEADIYNHLPHISKHFYLVIVIVW